MKHLISKNHSTKAGCKKSEKYSGGAASEVIWFSCGGMD